MRICNEQGTVNHLIATNCGRILLIVAEDKYLPSIIHTIIMIIPDTKNAYVRLEEFLKTQDKSKIMLTEVFSFYCIININTTEVDPT